MDQRYYASTYGRFNTPDPYGGSGHSRNPLSWNRYAYTGGDPINYNDPRGLDYYYIGCDPNAYDSTMLGLCLALMQAYGGAAEKPPGAGLWADDIRAHYRKWKFWARYLEVCAPLDIHILYV
jgi:hypothetical protein